MVSLKDHCYFHGVSESLVALLHRLVGPDPISEKERLGAGAQILLSQQLLMIRFINLIFGGVVAFYNDGL